MGRAQDGPARAANADSGSAELVATAFEHLPQAAVVTDAAGHVRAANRCFCRQFGWSREVLGRPLSEVMDADRPGRGLVRVAAQAGGGRHARLTSTALPGGDAAAGTVLLLRPIGEAGDASAPAYEALVHNASELIVVCDENGEVRYVSPALQRILGREPDEMLGWSPLDCVHPDDVDAVVAALAATMGLPGSEGPVECRARHADGDWRWLEVIVTNLLDDPAVKGIVLNARDVTDRKRTEQQLVHQALHDPLTGLANRALLFDRIRHALRRMQRYPDTPAAVILLDLDGFKEVNDTYGHDAGDRVLTSAAQRLRATVRPHDTVARLAGDEFVVVCDGFDVRAAEPLTRRLASALHAPFDIGETTVRVGASIGFAIARPGDDVRDILRRADAAMYREKPGPR